MAVFSSIVRHPMPIAYANNIRGHDMSALRSCMSLMHTRFNGANKESAEGNFDCKM
jgi:hypothetical protein